MEESKKKPFHQKKIAIALLIAAVLCVFCYYENNHLVVSQWIYESDKIESDLDGFRIVHISDLHNKSFGKDNVRLIRKIEELEPDIIVITGDIVDSYRTNIAVATNFVKEASKICSVYYVTGNHELRLDGASYGRLLNGITRAGGVVVNNELINIEKGDASFALVGIDDAVLQGNTLSELLKDNDKLSVVLAHEPDYFGRYVASGADLIMSGHAHGGQFRIPGLGGLVAPGQGFLPKLTEGIHWDGESAIVISRGLGNSIIPIRLFNDPEIVCIMLKTK